jgi:hypothetical protein
VSELGWFVRLKPFLSIGSFLDIPHVTFKILGMEAGVVADWRGDAIRPSRQSRGSSLYVKMSTAWRRGVREVPLVRLKGEDGTYPMYFRA